MASPVLQTPQFVIDAATSSVVGEREKSLHVLNVPHLIQCKALKRVALRAITEVTTIFSTTFFTALLKSRGLYGTQVAAVHDHTASNSDFVLRNISMARKTRRPLQLRYTAFFDLLKLTR